MSTFRDVILINEKALKGYSLLDENLSWDYIKDPLRFVQDSKVGKALGEDFYDSIRQEVLDASVGSYNKVLLDYFIKDILAWGVMAEVQVPLSSKIRNAGIAVQSDSNTSNIGIDNVQYTKAYYEAKSSFYLSTMVRYLCDNAEHYPLWCKETLGQSNWSPNIYLGK